MAMVASLQVSATLEAVAENRTIATQLLNVKENFNLFESHFASSFV